MRVNYLYEIERVCNKKAASVKKRLLQYVSVYLLLFDAGMSYGTKYL